MTIRDRLRNIGRTKAEPVQKGIFTGTTELPFAKLVNEKSASEKLLQANLGWVFKNNDAIAKEVSTIEFELFSLRIVGDEVVFNPIISHPILKALDKFNEFTSAGDGFYNTSSHKTLAGDAFWWIEGNVNNIYLLPPDKIELKFGDALGGQRIIESYEYKNTVDGEKVDETYPADDIIHFKNPNPENPFRGKSKVEAAAEAIDTDNFAAEANKQQYQRGLVTNFVLSTQMSLTDEQISSLKAQLRGASGIKNAFDIPVFSGGLEPKPIQMTNRDAQLIEQQKWQRDKIMSIFGNTPSSIGIVEDVNRANAEAGILHWKRTTIKSEMKNITDTLNEFFVPRFGDNLLLTFKDPVPEDRKSLIDETTKLKGSQIITTNEARELLGFDPSQDESADLLTNPIPEIASEVPKSILNVSYMKVLRRSSMVKALERQRYVKAQRDNLKQTLLPVAKNIIKKRKQKDTPEPRQHEVFTNEKVYSYQANQLRIVDAVEQKFANKVEQYIKELVKRALANVPDEMDKSVSMKALFDEDAEIVRAVIDFKPILMEAGILSAQHAQRLINDDSVYLPDKLHKRVERNVKKFARSMIKTDRDKIIDLIAEGVASGESIANIRRNITEVYEGYSKVQAERVTRSEVLRASNEGALDAWGQSDVVVGKQWLATEDDRTDEDCEAMNGEIVELEESYNSAIRSNFEPDVASTLLDYGAVESPPLHPNCRCTLIPVLADQKHFNAKHYVETRGLKNKITRLEKEIKDADKRTKDYKQKVKELEELKQLENKS